MSKVQRIDAFFENYIETLTNLPKVKEVCSAPTNKDPIYGFSMWQPSSLSNGLLGGATALFASCEHDSSLAKVAHSYLLEALNARSYTGTGVMSGIGGLLYVINVARASGVKGYSKLYNSVSHQVINGVAQKLARLTTSEDPITWEAYDIINGLSGLGIQLLQSADEQATQITDAIADYFISALCRPQRDIFARPNWSLSAENEPTELDKRMYPYGDANLGLAHGISGVISYLVSYGEANKQNKHPALLDTLECISEILLNYEINIQSESSSCQYSAFPARLYIDSTDKIDLGQSTLTRLAWCYGTPGMACSIYRAACLVNREDIATSVTHILLSHLSAPLVDYRLDGPTLCHGYGGLIMLLDQFWKWTHKEEFLYRRESLLKIMQSDFYEENSFFGFRHWMPKAPQGWRKVTSYQKIDSIGLLEGSSGVALALHSLYHCGSQSGWRSCFGI